MLKSFLRSAPVQSALAGLVSGYMLLIKRRTRWRLLGREHIEPIWREGRGLIGAFWHRNIVSAPSSWPDDAQPISIVISRSRDGAFIAKSAERVGMNVIRGSARNKNKSKAKGGMAAMRAMCAAIEDGHCVAITPDGPRGPRMRANLGAIRLAQATQAPILPLAVATDGQRVLSTWDRFVAPWPFRRGVIGWGPALAPLAADADAATLEHARQALEDALNAISAEVEEALGLEVTQPAARPRQASSSVNDEHASDVSSAPTSLTP